MGDDVDGSAVDVVLVGVHGYGRYHLRDVLDLAEADPGVRLAAVCDPVPPGEDLRGVPAYTALADLPPASVPRIAVIATPLHTHVDLALAAFDIGAHVLVEKPPASSMADFRRLLAGQRASGLACQVGFQSLGSAAVGAVRELVADGAVGAVRGIGIAGAWQRDAAYFGRSSWSGRRKVGDVAVVDGSLANPFAHALATALAVDGCTRLGEVSDVEVELYRANPIESDDTAAVRLRTARGTMIVAAVTLCAERIASPYVVVHGELGSITLHYKESQVRLRTRSTDRTVTYPTVGLLPDLVARVRSAEHELLVPVAETGAFMQVLEAMRLAPDPRPVQGRAVGSGPELRHVLSDVDAAVDRCAEELVLFSELGLEWTR